MDQKRENLLNLALETPEEERQRTENLNVGFEAATRSWEVIVKFHGNLQDAVLGLGEVGTQIRVEVLIAGYAILTVPETLMETVTDLEEIEYMEMPKRFFYSMDFSMASFSLMSSALPVDAPGAPSFDPADSACFAEVMLGPPFLTGRNVLLLVADSGIDWQRRDFLNADGTTRIRFLWDQTLEAASEGNGTVLDVTAPEGFVKGVEFSAAQINTALSVEDPVMRFSLLPSIDVSGHGTAVAGIAAGANLETGYVGAAPRSELLVVKLGVADPLGFPRTTELMRAVAWGLKKAEFLRMPLVINLSFGNSYGAHDGSSLLERFLDNA